MNAKKILIVGLDNSGKSSIILSLKGVKKLSAYTNTAPTRGIEQIQIEKYSQDFTIWDIGGQEQAREVFLRDIDSKIAHTYKIIYVIDIRDKERYSLSLGFLENIVDSIPLEKNPIEFSVFLHKFDPDYHMEKKELEDLIDSISMVFPQKISYEISKTSIFTTFKKNTIIE